jgi:outer membrane protein OmpA-like peptidoglycan-associated protein
MNESGLKIISGKIILVIVFLFFLSVEASAQNKTQQTVNIDSLGDCLHARPISLARTFGPTTAPSGYGQVLEIKDNNEGNKWYFEKEHNTAWYKLKITSSGTLALEVIPLKRTDDYDFLIFECEDEKKCCSQIKGKKIKPVRTNMSRTDTLKNGVTGLKILSQDEFIHSGPGNAYSKALPVEKNELYYLVLDNVYPNGAGHRINFKTYYTTLIISGKVIDETSKLPVESEVKWENLKTGEVLATGKTDSAGNYEISAPLSKNVPQYNLVVEGSSKHFFSDTIVNVKSLEKSKRLSFFTKLTTIITGNRFRLKNINFYPGVADFLPESMPNLERLLATMRKNPDLEISIEGHTNGAGSPSPKEQHIRLAGERAKAVYDYLVQQGIQKKRLSTISFGCDKMLYPKAKNEEEMSLNRRVEILVVKNKE